jgi:predicted nuclease with TOPRIM domain
MERDSMERQRDWKLEYQQLYKKFQQMQADLQDHRDIQGRLILELRGKNRDLKKELKETKRDRATLLLELKETKAVAERGAARTQQLHVAKQKLTSLQEDFDRHHTCIITNEAKMLLEIHRLEQGNAQLESVVETLRKRGHKLFKKYHKMKQMFRIEFHQSREKDRMIKELSVSSH